MVDSVGMLYASWMQWLDVVVSNIIVVGKNCRHQADDYTSAENDDEGTDVVSLFFASPGPAHSLNI
jgi:hypothetical protein